MSRFKYLKLCKLFNILIFICFLVFYVIPKICGMEFLHTNIGVVFCPYVHDKVNYYKITKDWSSYTLSDVTTMAKLISTRFPILVAYGIGSKWFNNDSDHYSWDTNYYQSYSQVYTCEAVANVNNASYYEHQENKEEDEDHHEFQPLQVYQGIFVSMSRLRVHLELYIAIEAIQKANLIFPGTVTGIVFYSQVGTYEDFENASLVLDTMKKVELKAAQYQIKIGTKQNCEGIDNGMGDIREKRRQIVRHSNFIICEVIPSVDLNVTEAVEWVLEKIRYYTKEIKTFNPWIDVMFETGWPSDWKNKTEIYELQMFWEYMEYWSIKYDVSLWVNEAFDMPWSYWEKKTYWGWWRLTRDNGTSDEEAYFEKVPHYGTKKKKPKGAKIALGKKKIQKNEQLIPPVLAFGRISKPKELELITPAYESVEDVIVPDDE